MFWPYWHITREYNNSKKHVLGIKQSPYRIVLFPTIGKRDPKHVGVSGFYNIIVKITPSPHLNISSAKTSRTLI
jgi:hypothetical protein